MTKPVRLQLSRKKGFNLQEHSRAVNGLEAVVVARPTAWGNPYSVKEIGREEAVRRFSDMVNNAAEGSTIRKNIEELRGKNLACWCKPGEPCHADVLLKVANGFECEAV